MLSQTNIYVQILHEIRHSLPDIERLPIPIDLAYLASCLGYKIEETSIQQHGYITETMNGERLIRVRTDDRHEVKRFTIAHEIGHILLNMYTEKPSKRAIKFRSNSKSWEEKIADRLAAELLMPMQAFQSTLNCYTYPSFQIAAYIARMFDVSFTACVRRITEVTSMLAFMFSYEISENTHSQYNIRPKQQYSTNNKLRFLNPPIDVVRNCLEHNLRTNEVWMGKVRFQMEADQVQIPSVGRVSSRNRQTYVTILGWRHLDSPVQPPMQANQLVAF
jgi:Zn-dependent peptidase ImmA (M78 family)